MVPPGLPTPHGWSHTHADICNINGTPWDIPVMWNWEGDPRDVWRGESDWIIFLYEILKDWRFYKIFILIIFQLCALGWGTADTQGGQRHWIPWRWSYRWLWVDVGVGNWTQLQHSFPETGNMPTGREHIMLLKKTCVHKNISHFIRSVMFWVCLSKACLDHSLYYTGNILCLVLRFSQPAQRIILNSLHSQVMSLTGP